MCEYTRLDRIRNLVIGDKLRMIFTENNMREARLRWFCHLRRKSMDAPVRRYESIILLESKRD